MATMIEISPHEGDMIKGATGTAKVRVFGCENLLLWEGPLHNLEGVSYV